MYIIIPKDTQKTRLQLLHSHNPKVQRVWVQVLRALPPPKPASAEQQGLQIQIRSRCCFQLLLLATSTRWRHHTIKGREKKKKSKKSQIQDLFTFPYLMKRKRHFLILLTHTTEKRSRLLRRSSNSQQDFLGSYKANGMPPNSTYLRPGQPEHLHTWQQEAFLPLPQQLIASFLRCFKKASSRLLLRPIPLHLCFCSVIGYRSWHKNKLINKIFGSIEAHGRKYNFIVCAEHQSGVVGNITLKNMFFDHCTILFHLLK